METLTAGIQEHYEEEILLRVRLWEHYCDPRRCRPLPSQQHPSLRLPARLSSSNCTVARVHMDPKVTFVVPCYKLAHLLSECVSSILDQTYTDFELLIMDDCSPDNTPEIAD